MLGRFCFAFVGADLCVCPSFYPSEIANGFCKFSWRQECDFHHDSC